MLSSGINFGVIVKVGIAKALNSKLFYNVTFLFIFIKHFVFVEATLIILLKK